MKSLDDLFRAGTVPPALDGRYDGELIAFDLAPGLTPLLESLARSWMPWKGKTFEARQSTGDNVFERASWTLAHILWPFYRGYVDVGSETFRAFSFRTYSGSGKTPSDPQVLKIDYDRPDNPPLSIRRVLDELVEIEPGVYLGKAHLRWWGRWQRVAFFLLRDNTLTPNPIR